MCGRYRLTRADRLADKFAVESPDSMAPRYNIAPTQPVATIKVTSGRRTVSQMRWGLIPNWAKDPAIAQINARCETVGEKPAFQESFERRRCLLPADGFYEWRRLAGFSQAFHFGMRDDSLFSFAGIWDRWRSTQGTWIESCAILTTRANALMADVHDRMPVILRQADHDRWLSTAPSNSESLKSLFAPFAEDEIRRFSVGTAVNDVRNDTPECIQQIPEFVSSQASLF